MFAGYLRLASIWLAAGWPDRLVVTWLTIIHRGTWWATPLDPSPHSWALSNLRRWVISYNYGCQPATVCGRILQRESPEILGWSNMLNPDFHPWFDRWKPCAEPSRRNKRSLPHCDSAFLGEVMACRRRMFWGYHERLHIRINYYYIAIIMGYYNYMVYYNYI